MPEQPRDPRHYDMKIPPEPDEATLKKEESKKPANDPNRDAPNTARDTGAEHSDSDGRNAPEREK